jgi:tetratricopeptide (TPR) repeat protein
VAFERFLDARRAGQPAEILVGHLNAAATAYHQALDELPPDTVTDRAVAHNELGLIYDNAGQADTALHHYQQSIKYKEEAGNRYGAGGTRYNIALMLQDAGRITDALAYAHAALRDFQTYGAGAADRIENTQSLIAVLVQDPRAQT